MDITYQILFITAAGTCGFVSGDVSTYPTKDEANLAALSDMETWGFLPRCLADSMSMTCYAAFNAESSDDAGPDSIVGYYVVMPLLAEAPEVMATAPEKEEKREGEEDHPKKAKETHQKKVKEPHLKKEAEGSDTLHSKKEEV